MKATLLLACSLFFMGALNTATEELPPSKVDFKAFVDTSEEVWKYREKRLINLDTFLKYQKESGTILLDTRSKSAYDRKHLRGAIHLNFSDFTDEKLAKVIPTKNTRILIYCNNNIYGDNQNFATKKVSMALNIPTFINLYGYGYENIYELSDLVEADNPKLEFEGSSVVREKVKGY